MAGTKGTPGAVDFATERERGGGPWESLAREVDAITGHLDGIDEEGRILFLVEGEEKSVPVAIGLDLADDALVRAASVGHRGLVIRTNEARPRLVLVGLVRERVSSAAREAGISQVMATLDGDTVALKADTQIELRCGKARITLHKDGRVEVSGTHVVNRSRGPMKLKGATVEIN
jgi:hypothetical protein